jgi:hypothetical protein
MSRSTTPSPSSARRGSCLEILARHGQEILTPLRSKEGRACLLAFVLTLAGASPLFPDVISQTNSDGRQVVIQRDAIIIKQDSSSITYKHFDLKQRRVVKEHLQESSLPYQIARSAPDVRQQIVSLWRRFGYVATVTDTSGKSTRVYDVYIDFYPPGGRGSLLDVLPARTDLPVELTSGGSDIADFADIARAEFQGDHLKLTMTDGQTKEGRLLPLTNKPVEIRFLGITDHYDPASEDVFDFSLPLDRIKQIDFEH